MRAVAPTGGRHPFWTGFIASILATAVVFLVADLGPRETSSAMFLVGLGLLLLGGVLLMLPPRTWLVGVGFLVGAVVSVAGWVVIGILSIVQHTV